MASARRTCLTYVASKIAARNSATEDQPGRDRHASGHGKCPPGSAAGHLPQHAGLRADASGRSRQGRNPARRHLETIEFAAAAPCCLGDAVEIAALEIPSSLPRERVESRHRRRPERQRAGPGRSRGPGNASSQARAGASSARAAPSLACARGAAARCSAAGRSVVLQGGRNHGRPRHRGPPGAVTPLARDPKPLMHRSRKRQDGSKPPFPSVSPAFPALTCVNSA